MKAIAGAAALSLLAVLPVSSQAQAQAQAPVPVTSPVLASVKIPVQDFERSVQFYVRYADMKDLIQLNKTERILTSASGAGANLVLYKPVAAKAEETPGRGFTLFMVPDVAAVAGRMKADGVTGMGKLIKAPSADLFIAHDPDGNIVEFLQMTGPLR